MFARASVTRAIRVPPRGASHTSARRARSTATRATRSSSRGRTTSAATAASAACAIPRRSSIQTAPPRCWEGSATKATHPLMVCCTAYLVPRRARPSTKVLFPRTRPVSVYSLAQRHRRDPPHQVCSLSPRSFAQSRSSNIALVLPIVRSLRFQTCPHGSIVDAQPRFPP